MTQGKAPSRPHPSERSKLAYRWARILLRHNKPLLRQVRRSSDWKRYLSLLRAVRGTPHEDTVWTLLVWHQYAADVKSLAAEQSARLHRAALELCRAR